MFVCLFVCCTIYHVDAVKVVNSATKSATISGCCGLSFLFFVNYFQFVTYSSGWSIRIRVWYHCLLVCWAFSELADHSQAVYSSVQTLRNSSAALVNWSIALRGQFCSHDRILVRIFARFHLPSIRVIWRVRQAKEADSDYRVFCAGHHAVCCRIFGVLHQSRCWVQWLWVPELYSVHSWFLQAWRTKSTVKDTVDEWIRRVQDVRVYSESCLRVKAIPSPVGEEYTLHLDLFLCT